MTKRQETRLPSWRRRLHPIREGQPAAYLGISIGERCDLAKLLMAEGLSHWAG